MKMFQKDMVKELKIVLMKKSFLHFLNIPYSITIHL